MDLNFVLKAEEIKFLKKLQMNINLWNSTTSA